jgi:hypothetical protein
MSVLMRHMMRRSSWLPRKRHRLGSSCDSGWLLVCDFIYSIYSGLSISSCTLHSLKLYHILHIRYPYSRNSKVGRVVS